MRKILISSAIIVLVLIGGAFFYFSGKEYIVRIPENEIQQKMAEKLPLTKSYLFIFSVTFDNPRVELTNSSERINAGLDVILNIKLGEKKKPLGGSLDVSGSIRYSREEGQFYLTDPMIEALSIQGIPDKYISKATTVLEKALADYYSTHPIYRLKEGDAKQATARLILKNVLIENEELVITLGI
ncbi:MAG: DUF1439 domain-containing protein [Porticoccaceae bacterium]